MLQKLGKFFFRVNFMINGFLLGLDKLALFKPGSSHACQVCSANCVDLLVLILFWSSTLLSGSCSDIF